MTQLWTMRLTSTFDAANTALAARTSRVLERYAAAPARHARFLNTLSMLEHMGCRKIVLTQPGRMLRHVAEEARHAWFFQRQAGKLSADAGYAAPAAARMYFQRLDATVTQSVGPDPLPYLYVSTLIELRAVWLYRLYAGVKGAPPLKTVLGEEDSHLADMAAQLPDSPEALCGAEQRLFGRLLDAFEQDLDGELAGALTEA